jgi:SAM-dependent methyltransferase
MRPKRNLIVPAVLLVAAFQAKAQDVPFLETPESVVEAMLELAQVTEDDVVYDLGSGDGRIVIAAAAHYGASGVGIESESELILLSNERAEEAGVEGRVRFLLRDFFKADFGRATVVMMYLSPKVNRKLQPLLAEQLAPGTRVVSHKYEIAGWEPVERIKAEGRTLYLYVVP